MRIALLRRIPPGSGGFVREETESRLRRWEGPVRVGLRFGASVRPSGRPPTAPGSPVSWRGWRWSPATRSVGRRRNPNFFIHIVSEDEREALGPVVSAMLPGLSPGDVAGITQMPRSTYCLVYAHGRRQFGAYTRAFAVIRAEHPDLLRLSCLHEELTQGLGLPNDSPRARPSIFNDDEEFALLTDHDEMLLRILYSPDLRPGMTAAEARPIVFPLRAG
jgi:hypothetical protein